MNPQKEFVNAIMSVLRLEQNVYVTASIEEIIDRIDIEDYTIFIAYLGERNGDFERPIQTIAKAVDEFYEKNNKPKRLEISNYAEDVYRVVNGAYFAIINNKETSFLQKNNKQRFATNEEYASVIKTNNTEIVDFIQKVKSISHINIKEITPIFNKVGGLDRLVEISRDGKIDLKNYIKKELGIEKYSQLSICEKIDERAKDGMSGKMLELVNNALTPIVYG